MPLSMVPALLIRTQKKMDVDLRRIVSDNFGFGDFIFRNPDTGEEIARVRNLKELQNILLPCLRSLSYIISAGITFRAGSIRVPCFRSRVSEADHVDQSSGRRCTPPDYLRGDREVPEDEKSGSGCRLQT